MANKKTYKNITHIPGQITLWLPDGTKEVFSNSTEAQAFFDQNYADRYSIEPISQTDNNQDVIINGGDLSEVVVVEQAPEKPKQEETSSRDPIRDAIFEGRYNGRRFTPTPENIQHFLDLYESDKHIAENYGGKAWGKVLAGHIGAGAAIYGSLATAPVWAPWVTKTAIPAATKHVLMPAAAGMAWDETQRALTGTTSTETISNWLQQEKGWNPIAADVVGGLSNPGYWINFGGTGTYTKPFFNKIGLGVEDARLALNPALQARINASLPKSKFQTSVVEPTTRWIDRNLYKFQRIGNPWLFRQKPMEVSSSELPSFKFVRNPGELQTITSEMRDEYPLQGGQVQDYLLFGSNRTNEKIFGDAMSLRRPNFHVKFHNVYKSDASAVDQALTTLGAGISGADVIFGSDDRNPWVRGLEYATLGRYGLDLLARRRLSSILGSSESYLKNFRTLQRGLDDAFINLKGNLDHHRTIGVPGREYRYDYRTSTYVPEGLSTTALKPGFNYKGASFDDLVAFLTNNSGRVNELQNYTVSDGVLYDQSGRILARKGANGSIDIVNEQAIRQALSKDIDVVDYATGQRFKGTIEVGNDGTVTIPEEYTRILRNNIDYIQNTLFPGSGIKPFGSAAGVIEAGFPHATHDIDFYITKSQMDKLLAENPSAFSARPSRSGDIDTWVYSIGNGKFGEAGNIDLNVIGQDANGMATGMRAEELYRQYFPEEYFQALRNFKADQGNGVSSAVFRIGRTPEELLTAVQPSSKTIMDSFDIDFTDGTKLKHALRSWAHLIYSDPQEVAAGLNQYARSMLGSRVQLFPMSAEQLGNKELNLQALQRLGVELEPSELDRIASDPQRMKNVLDAWYLMDNTAMRYIKGTWPGTTGYSSENFIRSATTWDPINNGGNANGAGLNVTIRGDSRYHGDLKAYISPRTEYKSDNLLDLITEVENNFGWNAEAPRLLMGVGYNGDSAAAGLQSIYDSRGWNFLQNGKMFNDGRYASATRPFDVNADYVGFAPTRTVMHPIVPRLKVSSEQHPLITTNYWSSSFTKPRQIPQPIDYNRQYSPFSSIRGIIESNYNRTISYRDPFYPKGGRRLYQGDLMYPVVDKVVFGPPIGLTGVVSNFLDHQDWQRRQDIERYRTLQDDIVLGMPEKDRRMFTPEGVDSLYNHYRTSPFYQGADQNDLDIAVEHDLRSLYEQYRDEAVNGSPGSQTK